MNWFAIYARWHHGYPLPEDNYEQTLNTEVCLRCGYHAQQVSPFRVRRTKKAIHSHFLQLNWVFDAIFVSQKVQEELLNSTLNGMTFEPVVNHNSGEVFDERFQMSISTRIKCVEVSQLPKVTCCINNEEGTSTIPGEKRYPEGRPFCNRVKYHPRLL